MSIWNVLVAQKSILLTLGAAVLFMLAALVLSLLPRIRARLAAYRRQQALQQNAREHEAAAVREAAMGEAKVEVSKGPIDPVKPVEVSTPVVSIPKGTPTVQPPVQAVEATASKPEEKKSGSVMQDILSSVFGNEEELAKFEVLCRGIDPITAEDLLTLATTVYGQLKNLEAPIPATKER